MKKTNQQPTRQFIHFETAGNCTVILFAEGKGAECYGIQIQGYDGQMLMETTSRHGYFDALDIYQDMRAECRFAIEDQSESQD